MLGELRKHAASGCLAPPSKRREDAAASKSLNQRVFNVPSSLTGEAPAAPRVFKRVGLLWRRDASRHLPRKPPLAPLA